MQVGDKVGLLETGIGYFDTFAGTEVEITNIFDAEHIRVRTHNGHEFVVGPDVILLALPKKRAGRKPVARADGERIVATSITLPESDMAFLLAINPKNVSAAIRKLISEAR